MHGKIPAILALLSFVLMPHRAIETSIDTTIDSTLQGNLQQESLASQEAKTDGIRTVVQEADVRIQPVANGVKFLLKSKMGGNRQLFWNDKMGSGQYRLRIQDANPNNKRAWWIFDARTRTMRSAT